MIQTVTAVAAIQDSAVRRHFCSIYWLVVGADAVGGRIGALQAMLYKQLTGKAVKGEEHVRRWVVYELTAGKGKKKKSKSEL